MHQNEFVCKDCFSDPGLRAFVERAAVSKQCSFCAAKSDKPIAAPLDEVVAHIDQCIHEDYDDAAECLPYESAEGGYQYLGKLWDTYDLLTDLLDLPCDINGHLFNALLNRMEQQTWCEANPYRLRDEDRSRLSWERFCHVVRHERRFFFAGHGRGNERDEILSPGEVLDQIFDFAEKVGLFVHLEPRTRLFRARRQLPGEKLVTAQELGPPPLDRATMPNRMSPSGIVMFYASDNPETALIETASEPGTFAVGCFETCREAVVLDLAALPPIPSLFEGISDTIEYHPRRVLRFLHFIKTQG